jgi:propanol-preferring alcohol dehydrogenase
VALARGATVHVLTRGEQARRLALELGAASAAGAADMPPEPLDAAILFAPVGELVLPALSALDRGGTLAVAGIHLSDIPP